MALCNGGLRREYDGCFGHLIPSYSYLHFDAFFKFFLYMGNIIKLLSAIAALLSLVVKILTLSTSEKE